MTTNIGELVEVWFRLERDQDGYPGQDWEPLWCTVTEEGFAVESIPFFVEEIAVGDLLAAKVTESSRLEFDRVISQSAHDTYRIWLNRDMLVEAESVLERLREFGCGVETVLERLVAIDAPPESVKEVRGFLYDGANAQKWEVQEACVNED